MTPHAVSAALASGAASLVEFIEAMTVVLAVGASRGLRSALLGAVLAVAVLAVLVALLGPALGRVPMAPAQLVLGSLLVLFGTRWLRKATRRAAGIIPLRDENAAFRRHSERIGKIDQPVERWDVPALAAAFQATAVEGLEVVFIVVAIGAGASGLLHAAIAGAASAFGIVCLLAVFLHRPITRVPENTLKQLVGSALSGLGLYWVGEGAGLEWPAGDLSIVFLTLAFLLLSTTTAWQLRRYRRGAVT
ncbi:hypothetical protein HN018_00745 [Lichenicola cladoniae]|uniref:GDT1 family protein n=1 Tax=Lichenicola cladoniae TaxID=1484109 RepID=A0A6M8HGI5_9PROT|nr:hypothetical protein [Lichenicola cladoniae]NPD65171.1 hypothetical protein [Acetobacteraceae bacterium]QKE88772.1 hypothetical protein HN018_00745 [Lichenicola cladoniae]